MLQERIKKYYSSIQLPEVFEEQDRGFAKCCHKFLVLASTQPESWKNDMSSAWIKVSDPSDTFSFQLINVDTNVATTYVPTIEVFPNEANAYFTTIQWKDVLLSDGEGCYELRIAYNISGIIGSFVWRTYELKNYSIENALGTARIRCLFNLVQEIEGINFTGANVEDSIRFDGQIRKDQPNSEYDDLIYQDRTYRTIVNENLPTFEMITDPYTDEVLMLFTDLYLLSANEMFISDYNAHTSSYRILDIPAKMSESPTRELPDKYSRLEYLKATISKRKANERTHF